VTAVPAAHAPAASAPLFTLRGLGKRFAGVRALAGVDLELHAGEVLGLVGENGAGKSTLIKILCGVHPHGSYTGEIALGGSVCRFDSAAAALAAGIAVVHQELSLVPDMTVAENLHLGREPARFGVIDRPRMIADARRLLCDIGADEIDAEALVRTLGVGQQQIVEITRALGEAARVVVLDEPTAALTKREAQRLLDLLHARKRAASAFVLVSHRLEEVLAVCDRVAVLRDGELCAVLDAAVASADEIVRLMTGKELGELALARTAEVGRTLLQVEHLRLDQAGQRVIDDVSLQVRAGEIVALAGAMGAGRTALLMTLFGCARGRRGGRILVDGQPVAIDAPTAAIAHGIGLVTEDRKGQGLVLGMSVADNLTLASLGRRSGQLLDRVGEERAAATQAAALRVKAPGLGADVATLSGGNQQKVVLGKWLLTEPRILLLDEPTRGVDVGAKAEIAGLLGEIAARGVAILMASSDLAEIVRLADRVVVLRAGRVAGELGRADASEDALCRLAIGAGAS
jgi:ABC-type sugar transport system ATPase subunit